MTEVDTSENKDSESSGTSLSGGSMGAKALQAGEKKKGSHYVWGAVGPNTFDCSGFVTYCYKQAGANLKGRVTSAGIRSNPGALGFKEIPWDERQPGDVVLQKGHVGMVYPGDKILESGGTTKSTMGYSGVGITNAKGRRFNKAYRYVGGGQ